MTAGLVAAANCLALDVLTAQTSDLLTAAGIPCLLLKGPATARRLYPRQPDRRTYGDVDLLVRPDRFDDAQEILRRNDYRWLLAGLRDDEFPWHETAFRAPEPIDLAIDLHRGFAGVTEATAFFDELQKTSETIDLDGSAITVPSVAGTALIVALHAANPGLGRKPLIDIQRAQQVFDLAIWQQAADLARLCGAESACRAGLELLPEGAELANAAGLGGSVNTVQWLGGRSRDRVSVSLATALETPGLRGKARYLIVKLLPSSALLRLHDVDARRGFIPLAAAHLRRLQRAAKAAPTAVADVLTARRAIHAGTAAPRPGQLRRIADYANRPSWRAAIWSLRTHAAVRKQLRRTGFNDLRLSTPHSPGTMNRSAVLLVLRVNRATCLERSLVIQRFDASAGRPRDLIVAVTAPGDGFRAHAWLDGDCAPDGDLREIMRRPPADS